MQVEDLMTKDVRTCSAQDTLNRAAQIFWEHDCGCAPIVDEDSKVLGIITDRDLAIAAYTQGKRLSEIPVSIAMNGGVQCCKPDDPVAAAEGLMAANKIRRLPVVDEEARLVGLVSLNDIAQQAARERSQRKKDISDSEVGETLASVCEPRRTQEEVLALARERPGEL